MKKLLLVILAGISFATANAQFQFGVKGGFNFNNFSGSDAQDAKLLVGYNVGAYAKLGIADRLSFRPELVYSAEGAKFKDVDESNHLNYLNVPLLLSYNVGAGVSIMTGPQVGFLLSAKDKQPRVTYDISDAIKSAEFAWAFGLGFHIPETPVGIDFRYNLGISNVEDRSTTGSNGSIRNSVFQLGVTYTLFKTGK